MSEKIKNKKAMSYKHVNKIDMTVENGKLVISGVPDDVLKRLKSRKTYYFAYLDEAVMITKKKGDVEFKEYAIDDLEDDFDSLYG